MMRVLWLIQRYEVHAFDLLAEALGAHMKVDLVRLDPDEQKHLKSTFERFDFNAYDRVMTTLRTKKEMRQWRVMRKVPNLVVFEYDACQNYFRGSKYKGRFSRYFRRLGGPRLIVSGVGITEKFCGEGFDAHFMPKGYDPRVIQAGQAERDVPLAFIGRLNRSVYAERKAMVELCREKFGLQVLRTQPGADYAKGLHRIRLFLSADIGLGEYMAKNFEAMAAGCVLVTYSQGDRENDALDFVDMQNVVLYQGEAELAEKLKRLFDEPLLAESISKAGATLARERFAYDRMGERLAHLLQEPLQPRRMNLNCLDRLPWG